MLGKKTGGRKKGTPNKKTALRNPALAAAAANPDITSLEWLTSVMKSPLIEPRLRIQAGIAAAKFVHALPGKATAEDTKIIEHHPIKEGDIWTPADRQRVRELEQMQRDGKRGFREGEPLLRELCELVEGEPLLRELCELVERDPQVDRHRELLMRFDGTQSLDDFQKGTGRP
jgi:hypothetical protein